MRDITITRQVFMFDELTPTAQATAIIKVRSELYEWLESNQITNYLNGDLFEIITGNCVGEIDCEQLTKDIGLKIEWRLSHCQGDGVAIYGTLNSDDAPSLNWGDATTAILARNHWGNHYTHGNCIDISLIRFDDDGNEMSIVDDGTFADQIKDICRKLERYGYQEIDNLTSEQYAVDHCRLNCGRKFNDDGTCAPSEFWAAQ